MAQILVTQKLAARNVAYKSKGIVIDASDVNAVIKVLKAVKIREIIIYDLTCVPKSRPGIKFPVRDHINRTGMDPIIGMQKALQVDFTDLSGLYTPAPDGIVTDCLGARFPGADFEYPSAWLCNVSIIARALNFSEISACLVNTPAG